MALVKLNKPHFLGDRSPRYFPEGSVVDWNGPLSKAMVPVDRGEAEGVQSSEDMSKGVARGAKKSGEMDQVVASRRQREREVEAARPRANPVPIPGGADKPMPDWAPLPRPAFSVPHTRDPKTIKPGEDEASIIREAASPPGTGSTPSSDYEAGEAPEHAEPVQQEQSQANKRAGHRVGVGRSRGHK